MYNIFNVIWFELIWFAWYDLKRDWRGSIWFYCGGFSHEKGLEDQSWRVNHMGLGIWWQLTQLTQLRQWQVGGWIIEATNHIPKWIDPVLKHGFLVFNSHIAHSPMIFAFFAHHYTMELWQFSPWLHEKNDRGRCCTLDLLSCTQRWRRSPIDSPNDGVSHVRS